MDIDIHYLSPRLFLSSWPQWCRSPAPCHACCWPWGRDGRACRPAARSASSWTVPRSPGARAASGQYRAGSAMCNLKNMNSLKEKVRVCIVISDAERCQTYRNERARNIIQRNFMLKIDCTVSNCFRWVFFTFQIKLFLKIVNPYNYYFNVVVGILSHPQSLKEWNLFLVYLVNDNLLYVN